jgi:hypothetical protein
MQYDIKIDNADLIVILAALGKQKAMYESLGMFEEAHRVSDVLVKFRTAKPLHAEAS